MKKIFLDPGHGGKDPGASGNGIKEKDITLLIAKKTRDLLLANYSGVDVQLSRTGDTFPSLSDRTSAANKWGADLLISIHINAATSKAANGFESFIYTNTSNATKAFQNVLHKSIMKYIGLSDRGQSAANLHMVRESNMSAVLTESGFISNAKEAALMKSDIWLNKVAAGHAEGIAQFAGLVRKAAAERTASVQPAAKKVYKVQIGSFEDRKNAQALVTDLQKLNYRPVIVEQ